MVDPQDIAAARRALGAQLAAGRDAAGMVQKELARRVNYHRSSVANVETGRQNVPREFWLACDKVLDTGTALTDGYDDLESLLAQKRGQAMADAHLARQAQLAQLRVVDSGAVAVRDWAVPTLGAWSSAVAVDQLTDVERDGAPRTYPVPHGRFFAGSSMDVRTFPAVDGDLVLAAVPAGYVDDPFLVRRRRGLVLGLTDGPEDRRVFGIDARHARRRLAQGLAGSRLRIPRAYALDELTLGILWAVTNLDEALLNDDAEIARCQVELAGYETLPRSSAARDGMGELSAVAQMWMGSQFCARHILRHMPDLSGTPAFWTREQHGEEASTWLLFTHKYDYLQAVADRVGSAPMVRSLCVPPSLLAHSPRPERMLFVLAVALMESFRIEVRVCAEPEYAAVEGFVLDRDRRAIVANWVDSDGIWHVDLTDRRSRLREYADITGHAAAHSIIAGPDPGVRLRRLVDYLDLDWAWLVRRCAELAAHGCAGLAQPRSRMLSTAGMDRACRFLAEVATAGQ